MLHDASWELAQDAWEPDREAYFAAVMSQGNGYMAARGAWELAAGDEGSPGAFVAGVYADRPGEVRELVRAPDWTRLRLTLKTPDGRSIPVDSQGASVDQFRRRLSLRSGLLVSHAVFPLDAGARLTVVTQRFVSLASEHRVALTARISAERISGTLVAEAGWGPVPDQGGCTHLHPVRTGASAGDAWLLTQTRTGEYVLAFAGRLLGEHGRALEAGRPVGGGPGARSRIEIPLDPGDAVTLRWLGTVYTSRDETDDPLADALRDLDAFARDGQSMEFSRHARQWVNFWGDADVVVDGDSGLQRAVRFAAYHLRCSANPHDPRVSIGAKGLCDGYRGHVFWDTEIFMLPFFTATRPEIARSLLTYRHATLPGARRRAAGEGLRGARYPWESTDRGDEACPETAGARIGPGEMARISDGKEQIHVTADVAFAVARYVAATGDETFFADYGVEILLETARFWASRVQPLEGRDLYEVKQVVGPDEGHQGVNNNLYTNAMAAWNLREAARAAERLSRLDLRRWRELRGRLGLDGDEIASWRRVADRIVLQQPDEGGVIDQFDGYREMPDIPDYEAWIRSTTPEERRRQWIPYGTQLLKQPDVVMVFALFPEMYTDDVKRANLDYYEPRTTHRSSLGMAIHGIVNCDVGRVERGLEFIRRAAAVDLQDGMGNARLGVHTAAAGGIWFGLVRGIAGVRFVEGGFRVAPRLPKAVCALRFQLRYRSVRVCFEIDRDGIRVRREGPATEPVSIGFEDGCVILDAATPEARRP